MGDPRPLLPEDASQAEQAGLLRETGNGPTVENEEELLREEFGAPDENGIYGALTDAQALIAPTGVGGMVKRVEKDLGLGEPNYIQSWYRSRNGNAYGGNFAWCNAAITRWAYDSGNHPAVCFGTDYAYTVSHASRFKTKDRWHVDVAGIKRGDIVFFDWGGTNDIARIDHIGIVTSVKGGNVYTIEGNTSDRCLRRVRTAGSIVGYGRPAYTGSPAAPEPGKVAAPSGSPYLRPGSKGSRVNALQRALNAALKSGLDVDGDFGPRTEDAVKSLQRRMRIAVDGVYGPDSARALARLLA